MGPKPYKSSAYLAEDKGHSVLQYYITILAIIGYGRFVRSLSKLYSRHLNFYCKKLTQVEVGYGLLNVAQYVSCKVLSLFFFAHMLAGSIMVTYIPKQS